MRLGGQPGLAGCPGASYSGGLGHQGPSRPGPGWGEQLGEYEGRQGPATAADGFCQMGRPALNGRHNPGPRFAPELPAPRGAQAIELSQLLLQLGSNPLRQPQRRPAPIPAGSSQIPEGPLLAKQTALAELADLNLQPAPGTRRHQGHTPTDPSGGGVNKQRTCHGEDRQRTAQPGAARTRGA